MFETTSRYRFREFELDTRAARLTRSGSPVPLRPRIYRLLEYLLRNPQRLVTKEDLVENVWDGAFVTDNAVSRAVARLRSALGDDPRDPSFLETVHGEGYRFLASVEGRLEDDVGAGSVAADDPAAAADPRRPRIPVWAVAGALAIVAIVGLAVLPHASDPDDSGRGAFEGGLLEVAAPPRQVTVDVGMELFPSLSPGGSALAYASDRSGRLEVYTRSLAEDGRDVLLTQGDFASVHPAWSPDGERIAFHRFDRDQSSKGIWVVSARGGTPRQVTTFGARPSWSPDGRRLVFQQVTGGYHLRSWSADPGHVIWEVDLEGGDAAPLTRPGDPAGGHGLPVYDESGDGVLFVAEDQGFSEVWRLDIASGELERILDEGRDPAVATGGRMVFYRGEDSGIHQLPSRGAEPSPLIPGAVRHPTMSADGRRLAYSRYTMRSNLWSLPLDPDTGLPAGPSEPLTQATNRNTSPKFSPDGSRLVYFRTRNDRDWELWLLDLRTDESRLLHEVASRGEPAWIDDNRVHFASRTHALRIDVRTRRVETLAELDDSWQSIAFSRDGEKLSFHRTVDGETGVWVSEIGGTPRRLNEDPRYQGWSDWSPDGTQLAVEMSDPGTPYYLAVVPTVGGLPRRVSFEEGGEYTGGWSWDGAKYVFPAVRNRVWNLHLLSFADGKQEQLTHYETPLEQGHVRYPELSPSGDRVVYELTEFTADVWMADLR